VKSDPNLSDPDGFFEALIAAHEGLDEATGNLLNARLVLLLANQVGDLAVLRESLAAAREGLEPPPAAEAATAE